ncbi:MAG: hypothetical protein LC737_02880, partial [Chloroflexi bacterium]|nr:hypothetical protein [Chloroflexota bacterium]
KLIPYLGTEQPFLAFEPRDDDGVQSYGSVHEIAARYLDELKQVQPTGPYLLGGACIGGKVALEMARQLRAQGDQISALILLDSHPIFDLELRTGDGLPRSIQAVRTHLPEPLRVLFGRVRYHWRAARKLQDRARVSYLWAKARSFNLPSYQTRSRYMRSVVHHNPKPYAGDMTIFASKAEYDFDPMLGWRDLVCGQLDVRVVPGDHSNYLTTYLDVAGPALSKCLGEAQVKAMALRAD